MDFQKLERVRIAVALVAAVITGGAALFGVYAKSRSESRQDTAASYETLAPEVNQLKAAIEQLRVENQQLRAAVGIRAPAIAEPEPTPSRAPAQARTPARRQRPAPGASERAPAEKPPAEGAAAEQAPAGDKPATGEKAATDAPAGTQQPAPAEEKRPDILEEVEKKVPVDFESAAEIWKRVKDYRKANPQ